VILKEGQNMELNNQELSEEIIEKLEKMKQEMLRSGWDREKVEAQAEAFS
jgi:Spy/CpxP family protein refolding chaperone